MLRACERVHERSVVCYFELNYITPFARLSLLGARGTERARVVSLYLSITLSLSLSLDSAAAAARLPLTFRIYQAAQIVARLFGDLSHTITNASATSIYLLLAEFSRKRINLSSPQHLYSPLSLSLCFAFSLFLLFLLLPTLLSRLLPRRSSTQRSQLKFITSSHG